MSRIEFGVNLWGATSASAWKAKVRDVERMGFSIVSVPDHLGEFLAPLPALVSAAEACASMRVASNVLNNDLRHPAVLAQEAATVDLLSDGRLILGLGAGHAESEYQQVGLNFASGLGRVERLEETVTILKGLFHAAQQPDGEDHGYSFQGAHYQLKEHVLSPVPVQAGGPPLLVGGNGNRLLGVAARHADLIGLTGISFATSERTLDMSTWRESALVRKLDLIHRTARADASPPTLNALVQVIEITANRQKVAEKLCERWSQLTPADVLATPFVLIGTVEEIADELRAHQAKFGISYFSTFEKNAAALASVIERLV